MFSVRTAILTQGQGHGTDTASGQVAHPGAWLLAPPEAPSGAPCWKPGVLVSVPGGRGRTSNPCPCGGAGGGGVVQARAGHRAAAPLQQAGEGGRPSGGAGGPQGLSSLAGWGLLSDTKKAEVLRSPQPGACGQEGAALISNGDRQDAPEGQAGASCSAEHRGTPRRGASVPVGRGPGRDRPPANCVVPPWALGVPVGGSCLLLCSPAQPQVPASVEVTLSLLPTRLYPGPRSVKTEPSVLPTRARSRAPACAGLLGRGSGQRGGSLGSLQVRVPLSPHRGVAGLQSRPPQLSIWVKVQQLDWCPKCTQRTLS